MAKFGRLTPPIPGNAKKCEDGHHKVTVLQCRVAGCTFGSRSQSVQHHSVAETLLIGHLKKVNGNKLG